MSERLLVVIYLMQVVVGFLLWFFCILFCVRCFLLNIKKYILNKWFCGFVVFVLGVGYYSCFIYESDPLLSDVKNSAWRNEKDFSHVLLDHISVGASISEVVRHLELKGFVVHKTDSSQWNKTVFPTGERYVARLEWRPNPIVLVKAIVVLVVVNEKIVSVSGKNYFTSI
ncbi:hypothetical protein [Pseudomonas sp.]|uniref:hypothetical protein n=1 Tax=Pseudomonas sp. TaxID=306 RepID=UPI003A97FE59